MDFIIDAIVEWLKGLLVDGIMGNLDGLFDNVNQSVGEIATQVGTTPADWNAGGFSMIRQISETAILPIAGVILTFVMTYELIQMLIERNNLHEVDTWMFFKWVFKTFVAVMILTNNCHDCRIFSAGGFVSIPHKDKVALVISLIALAVCLLMALHGILSDGLKGLKQRSKPIGISFLIYAVAFLLFIFFQ